MPIYQTNIYVCDLCGKVQSITEDAYAYTDPVVFYPPGWGNTIKDGVEIDVACQLCCGSCSE